MGRTTWAVSAAGAVVMAVSAAGCGSTSHFVDKGRPPTPVDATVYINNAKVSVSPASIGAGPVIFYITNHASRSESLAIQPLTDSGRTLASAGPINPQQTSQVTVDFASGVYRITTGTGTGAPASSGAIAPATLRIGKARPAANGALLQP